MNIYIHICNHKGESKKENGECQSNIYTHTHTHIYTYIHLYTHRENKIATPWIYVSIYWRITLMQECEQLISMPLSRTT